MKTRCNQKDIIRFKSKIILPINIIEDCWEFSSTKDKDGYYYFKTNKTTRSHIFSYIMNHQLEDISDKVIRHTCDHPWCVNPNHLRIGTQEDNIQDKINKNRQAKGSKIGNSKLTEVNVSEMLDNIIIKKYKSVSEISNKYNISTTEVRDILDGKLWIHVTKKYDIKNIKNMIVKSYLKENQVIDIKKRLKNCESQKSIAKLYCVDPKTIYSIKNNLSFQNVLI